MTMRVSHAKENVAVGVRTEVAPKKLASTLAVRHGARKRLSPAYRPGKAPRRLKAISEASPLNRVIPAPSPLGTSPRASRRCMRASANPEASFLILGMPFPFPADKCAPLRRVWTRWSSSRSWNRPVRTGTPCGRERVGQASQLPHRRTAPEWIADVVEGREKTFAPSTARSPSTAPDARTGPPSAPSKTPLHRDGRYRLLHPRRGAPLGSLHTQTCMGSSIRFSKASGRQARKRPWP
jgi:hypothetical protein